MTDLLSVMNADFNLKRATGKEAGNYLNLFGQTKAQNLSLCPHLNEQSAIAGSAQGFVSVSQENDTIFFRSLWLNLATPLDPQTVSQTS